MQQLQMDRDALNRTLRELCKLDSFEYVPPFRGRAIHFRRRDVPFNELKIDHETLAARKKADYEKLDRMVAYAQSRSCRQKSILEYFGDASASNCGICDRCQGKTGWPNMPKVTGKPEPSAKEKKSKTKSPKALSAESVPAANEAVNRVALENDTAPSRVKTSVEPSTAKLPPPAVPVPNSVASTSVASKESKPALNSRNDSEDDQLPTSLLPSETKPAYDLIVTILKAVERTHGYLSKTLLSQHLSGVESKAVQGLRLQRLPEFGILKSWKKSHASGFLDQLLDVELLCISELRAGKVTVSISDQGRGLVAGTVEMPAKIMLYVHQCLLAAEKSNGIATTTPSKPQDWSDPIETAVAVKTSPKMERLQTQPISTVGREQPTTTSDEPVRPLAQLPRATASDASAGRDVTAPMIEDWRWTVRLVEHGYRLGECALIRGKTPDAILEDLTKALQDGKRFTIEQLFDRRTQIAVKELREQGDLQTSPPSIFQSYPSLWRFIQRWLELG